MAVAVCQVPLMGQERRALHENSENAAMPISAMMSCLFFPRHMSPI
jgi:hypothetical protein